MRPYETVIIFMPELEDSAIESFVERVLELVRANGGTPGTVDRWGRRTLAYEVKHHREGYYVLLEFSAEPKAAAELDRFLLLLDEVLRHKIVRVPEKVARRVRSGAPAHHERGRRQSA
jgi:small subunit ribosomal protein S6